MEPLVTLKMWSVPVAALVPMIIGFIWYNPKVFGKAWMESAEVTEEKIQGANMAMIFILSYIFACLLAFIMMPITIHQLGLQSLLLGADETTIELGKQVLNNTVDSYRSFKHGTLHGTIAGLLIALPVIATNALFERKSWKYIWINVGYWVISMALMGGVVCQLS